ncbi:MAG: bifunctional diaminohydroxyphosphoribosylaminopyrimidine deaminase/5-amino-6-(5-phosphoribosylamino)uracil reductase RibD [Candidatus Kaelpia aquatica]|nr:bifunctional diaminohydroxyphosphoribosylaminopyrimidine deaminase/5-amino-6-(5-phosphoribosylamino)uracil reductase RibD [Candidatus Kaelpia aquatica]
MKEDRDLQFMHKAISLAEKAEGETNPNPMVGAVLVDKNNKIISEGYHRRAGASHAEVIAIEKAGVKAKGSTLYVSLEPCSSYGKTSPCVDKIIESGIKRTVIAALDPNPKNHNKSVKILRESKIEVKVGVMKAEAEYLNRVFSKHIRERVPYVSLKTALSLDGRIADSRGVSKWISSSDARDFVHREIRSKVDAIMVGIDTILKDDPSLTLRNSKGGLVKDQPLRVVLDSTLRVPLESNILKPSGGSVLIATLVKTKKKKKREELIKRGVRIIDIACSNAKGLDLKRVLKALYREGICHLLVEGGSSVLSSFLERGLADYVYFFISNMVLGGDYLMYNGREFKLDRCPKIVRKDCRCFNNSIMVSGDIVHV